MSDVENMLPWERDVYLMKLEKQLAEEKRQQIEAERKSQSRNR